MRFMVGPSAPTMIDVRAVVWFEVGGESFVVRSRARYCEKQPAWAAPSSSSGFVPLPSAKRDALVKLPSRPVAVDIVPEPSSIVPSQRAVAVAAMSRSEEHTSELQSLMRLSYAVFCLKKKKITKTHTAKQH